MVRIAETQAEELVLSKIVRREVERYAGESDTDTLYAVMDDEQQLYTVILIPGDAKERPAWVIVMAQIVNDKVIILEDVTYQPLVDALMGNGGIPREQIVLAYQGEKLK